MVNGSPNLITVPAQAIAEPMDALTGGGRIWKVTVFTPPWWHRKHREIYFIPALHENLAAQEALGRFQADYDAFKKKPLILLN